MNNISGAHVAATAGIAGNIAAVIVWLSNALGTGHWFPVDSATAIAMGTLIVSAFGPAGIWALKPSNGENNAPPTSGPTAPKQ